MRRLKSATKISQQDLKPLVTFGYTHKKVSKSNASVEV